MLWVIKAQNLFKGAELLEEHDLLFDAVKTNKGFSETKFNLVSVILMLRGMGFECLLKGLLTKQGKISSKNGKLNLPPRYQGHNLRNMVEDVEGLVFTKDEFVTLQELSAQISLGRLPLKQAPTKQQMEQTGGWNYPHDEKLYKDMLHKILAV